MRNVLIWRTGQEYNKYYNLIRYEELKGNLKIIGVTSKDVGYTEINGIPFIPIEEMNQVVFEYIIILSLKWFDDIKKDILKKQIAEERRIISIGAFLNFDFDFNKYISMLEIPVTILSNNCMAGMLYKRYALPFSSPLIAMWETEKDFLKLVSDPKKYLEAEPILQRYTHTEIDVIDYPVVLLDDIIVYANHYKTFEDFLEKWEKRRSRINYDNLKYVFSSLDEDNIYSFLSMCPTGLVISNGNIQGDRRVVDVEKFAENIQPKYEFETRFSLPKGRTQAIDFLSFLVK